MTRSSKRIAWIQDRLFSLKLRNGHYALLQMLTPTGQVVVFNCFHDVDEWDVRLTADNVLLIGVLLDSVLIRSNIAVHKDVEPVVGLKYPEDRIYVGDGFRTVRVWQGTEDEREFLMMGDCKNSLYRVRRENNQIHEECTPIDLDDFEKCKDVELTNLYDYPSFNERLFLCELFGRNVDPLKEIAFNRPLPREYRTYIDIIAGRIRLN